MCFRQQRNNSSQFTVDGDVESVCAGHVFMGQRESVCAGHVFIGQSSKLCGRGPAHAPQ